VGDRLGARLRRRPVTAQPHRRLRRDRAHVQGPAPLNFIGPECIASYAPDAAAYRAAAWPGWIDELDLSVTTAHVRLGTRTLKEADWLLRDERAPAEIALRRRLLSEQRDYVFACNTVAAPAAAEAAGLVEGWLGARGLAVWDGDPHPLAHAAMSIQEDLCLMVHHHGAWHLEGACLCFPSMWSLVEKLGLPVDAVHRPVPHYAEELAGRVDTFFDRLLPDKVVWRRNLSLWPCCLLWVPTTTIAPELWDPAPPDGGVPRLWLRSERQTLRRLPDSGAVLFTIRVQMAPLSILSGRPDRAAGLAAWLRAPGGESRRDQLGALLGADLAWLDVVAEPRSA
jgi:hypothetical protein